MDSTIALVAIVGGSFALVSAGLIWILLRSHDEE